MPKRWFGVTTEEINIMKYNKVWELVDLPPSLRVHRTNEFSILNIRHM